MPIMNNIRKVGVVGAGTMGQGIALTCAMAGYETLIFDIDPAYITQALELVDSSLRQIVNKGKLSNESARKTFERIKPVMTLPELQADLLIEAVIEDINIKQKLFIELEVNNGPDVILASNTSSISISEIAFVLKDPSRFVGLHFFNPAHLMKLVEVISGNLTRPKIVDEMKKFSQSIGKTPVVAKDSPGFIVNRVARHFYLESLNLLEEEVSDIVGIDKLLKSAGFKMGPFEVMDLIGIDVNHAVTTSVYKGFNNLERFKPSQIQKKKIDQGYLGRKTGRGFYEYSKNQ